MARTARTHAQREMQRTEMVKLLRRGWTFAQVANKFGISHTQLTSEWKIVVRQMRKARDADTAEKVAMLLEELAEVKQEAWDAWEQSKQPRRRVTVETFTSSGSPSPGDPEYDAEAEYQQSAAHTTPTGKKGKKAGKNRKGEEDINGPPVSKKGGRDTVQNNSSPDGKVYKRTKRSVTKEGRLPANEYLSTVLKTLDMQVELEGLKPEVEVTAEGQINWDQLAAEVANASPDEIERKLAQLTEGQIAGGNLPPELQAAMDAVNPPPAQAEFTEHTPEPPEELTRGDQLYTEEEQYDHNGPTMQKRPIEIGAVGPGDDEDDALGYPDEPEEDYTNPPRNGSSNGSGKHRRKRKED